MRAAAKTCGSFLATGLSCTLLICSVHGALSADCKPRHPLPTIMLRDMGACAFDPETLSFAGSPVAQAMCLMRGMDASRNLAPPVSRFPPALAGRIGETTGLPSREELSSFLSKQDLEWDFAAYLWQPVARARDNDPDAPSARYLVIHDTSGPNYGRRSFPDDIDTSGKLNNLANFVCSDGWGRAHVVVNRSGDMLLDHDFAIPWRQTKFERAVNFNGALKGLFLHVELIQPRRSASGHGSRNDAQAPDPAFSVAQYDRLALLYVIASVRADRWLIPAFHAAVDATIPDGHDDPMSFNIDSFADRLDRLVARLAGPEQSEVSAAGPAAAPPDNPALSAGDPWIDAQWERPTKAIATPSIVAPPAAAQASLPTVVGSDPSSAAAVAPPGQATSKPPPSDAIVTSKQSESDREATTADADHCQTRVAKGHRWRYCEPARAASRGRGSHAVRSVDRGVSAKGDHARHHRGDLHTRHARDTARHNRA